MYCTECAKCMPTSFLHFPPRCLEHAARCQIFIPGHVLHRMCQVHAHIFLAFS